MKDDELECTCIMNEDVTTFFLGGSCHAIPQSVLALGLYYNIISVGNIKSAKVTSVILQNYHYQCYLLIGTI